MNRRYRIAPLCLAVICLGLNACGSKADRAYRACAAKIEEGIAELRRESAEAQAIAGPLLDISRSAGIAGCEAIREACRNQPDGIVCRNALEELDR